jgi:hypothetical protein
MAMGSSHQGSEYETSGFFVSVSSTPPTLVVGEPATLHFTLKDYRQNSILWSDLVVYHACKIHVVL